MRFVIGLMVSVIVLVGIAISAHTNKDEVGRLQELKNKKRSGDKRLSHEDAAELDRLLRKYWWH